MKSGKPKGLKVGQIIQLTTKLFKVVCINRKYKTFNNYNQAKNFSVWYLLNI
jgi:ASC-1-like (ASCH) protein